MAGGLTIGQAAAFTGVTIKTVRHYHRLGLLGEPQRDSSGYRRYTSADLLRLVQVRTLAEAGVPLAEIDGLLDADPERFTDALADIDRQLSDRIDALIARRDTLQRLADGDRSLLPQRACAVLDRLTELGFRPDFVATQREGLVLARALDPEFFDGFVTQLEHRLEDPEYVELQKRAWDALSWDPEDPRLEEIASALADNLLTNRALMEAQADVFSTHEAITRYGLINHHRAEQMPSMARLTALIEAELRAAGFDIPYR
ncbi:MerR family transcriptional regulator [Nocardiopsis xinjiangensis]|uniref:MerR family transcriptional regulator n=1 Tax=Nocardiopsis xinjiangensis TaxID=124285 RepID=UPI00034C2443|nr:MerR family transcriptional regulator [Nocardiopsis xinjiangensis]